MSFKYFISSVLIILAIAISLISSPGCANIIPPQGGPRDSLPPVLEKVSPADSTLNFTGNKITFTFDEFIEVQNISENLIFSPTPSVNPYVEYKLKTVSVKLKDSLEANTTYTINFGNAIKDFTEGNPYKNFTYTFSTGNFIDSLELKGNVLLAETGKIDTTLIVMLHTNSDDSAVIKERPRYFTKLDSKGNFHFKNLPRKTFYLYALKDDNNTKRYTSDKSLFAFADKPVVINEKTEPIILNAYTAKTAEALPANNPARVAKPSGTEADKRLKYQTNLIGGQQDLLSDFYFIFNDPLKFFDVEGLKLFTDSTYTPASTFRFLIDSSNTKISLLHQWKQNTQYHIILNKSFAEDSLGKKLLKDDTLNFTTKGATDYGSLKIKLRNLELSKNPVLQILQNSQLFKSFPMTSIDFSQEMFLPGEYELRILYDSNKNGIWDPGDFFNKHLQPELTKPIDRKISVKAAWQNEFEIIL